MDRRAYELSAAYLAKASPRWRRSRLRELAITLLAGYVLIELLFCCPGVLLQ